MGSGPILSVVWSMSVDGGDFGVDLYAMLGNMEHKCPMVARRARHYISRELVFFMVGEDPRNFSPWLLIPGSLDLTNRDASEGGVRIRYRISCSISRSIVVMFLLRRD